jgi:hypothetical protein
VVKSGKKWLTSFRFSVLLSLHEIEIGKNHTGSCHVVEENRQDDRHLPNANRLGVHRGKGSENPKQMKTIPLDTKRFMPTWTEIKDKAHLYATARLRTTGEWVKIVAVVKYMDGLQLAEPCFAVRFQNEAGHGYYKTEELCDFCL